MISPVTSWSIVYWQQSSDERRKLCLKPPLSVRLNGISSLLSELQRLQPIEYSIVMLLLRRGFIRLRSSILAWIIIAVFCCFERFASVSHWHSPSFLGQTSAIISQPLRLLLATELIREIFETKRNLSLNKYPNNKAINQATHSRASVSRTRGAHCLRNMRHLRRAKNHRVCVIVCRDCYHFKVKDECDERSSSMFKDVGKQLSEPELIEKHESQRECSTTEVLSVSFVHILSREMCQLCN